MQIGIFEFFEVLMIVIALVHCTGVLIGKIGDPYEKVSMNSYTAPGYFTTSAALIVLATFAAYELIEKRTGLTINDLLLSLGINSDLPREYVLLVGLAVVELFRFSINLTRKRKAEDSTNFISK